MTPGQFRNLALELPEAVEGEHMDHPDFRVRGRIFATLESRGRASWGVVRLTAAQQRRVVAERPAAFEPAAGAWGRRGYTRIRLAGLGRSVARQVLLAAWRNTAPKRLARELGPADPAD